MQSFQKLCNSQLKGSVATTLVVSFLLTFAVGCFVPFRSVFVFCFFSFFFSESSYKD